MVGYFRFFNINNRSVSFVFGEFKSGNSAENNKMNYGKMMLKMPLRLINTFGSMSLSISLYSFHKKIPIILI